MEYLIDVKRYAGYEGETKMNLTWAGSCLSGASRRVGEKIHFSKSQSDECDESRTDDEAVGIQKERDDFCPGTGDA